MKMLGDLRLVRAL